MSMNSRQLCTERVVNARSTSGAWLTEEYWRLSEFELTQIYTIVVFSSTVFGYVVSFVTTIECRCCLVDDCRLLLAILELLFLYHVCVDKWTKITEKIGSSYTRHQQEPPKNDCTLHSALPLHLTVPPRYTALITFGRLRAFSVAGPTSWNSFYRIVSVIQHLSSDSFRQETT